MEFLVIFMFSVTILLPLILMIRDSYMYLKRYWRPLICGSSGGPCHDPFDVPRSDGEEGFITKEGAYNEQE